MRQLTYVPRDDTDSILVSTFFLYESDEFHQSCAGCRYRVANYIRDQYFNYSISLTSHEWDSWHTYLEMTQIGFVFPPFFLYKGDEFHEGLAGRRYLVANYIRYQYFNYSISLTSHKWDSWHTYLEMTQIGFVFPPFFSIRVMSSMRAWLDVGTLWPLGQHFSCSISTSLMGSASFMPACNCTSDWK